MLLKFWLASALPGELGKTTKAQALSFSQEAGWASLCPWLGLQVVPTLTQVWELLFKAMLWESLPSLCLLCLMYRFHTILSPVSWSHTVYFVFTYWFPLPLTLFHQTPSWLFLHLLSAFCWGTLHSLAFFCLLPSPVSCASKNPAPAPLKKGEVGSSIQIYHHIYFLHLYSMLTKNEFMTFFHFKTISNLVLMQYLKI